MPTNARNLVAALVVASLAGCMPALGLAPATQPAVKAPAAKTFSLIGRVAPPGYGLRALQAPWTLADIGKLEVELLDAQRNQLMAFDVAGPIDEYTRFRVDGLQPGGTLFVRLRAFGKDGFEDEQISEETETDIDTRNGMYGWVFDEVDQSFKLNMRDREAKLSAVLPVDAGAATVDQLIVTLRDEYDAVMATTDVEVDWTGGVHDVTLNDIYFGKAYKVEVEALFEDATVGTGEHDFTAPELIDPIEDSYDLPNLVLGS